MKLHKDGTIEGTPQEIALYTKLTEVQKKPFKEIPPRGLEEYPSNVPNPLYPGVIVAGTIDTRDLQPIPTTKFTNYSSVGDYVRGLLSASGNKDNLH